jgi:hypothetical protein
VVVAVVTMRVVKVAGDTIIHVVAMWHRLVTAAGPVHMAPSLVGVVVTLVCLVNGIAVSPASAPQQTVQELRFVEAALGAILFALGIAIYELGILRRAGAEQKSAAATEKLAEEKPAEVGTVFVVGSRVTHKDRGVGEVTKVDGEVVKVQFGNRSSYHLSRDLKPLLNQTL